MNYLKHKSIKQKFILNTITLSISLSLISSNVIAQQIDNEDIEVIEVKGIARGIEAAKSIKRFETQFVDAIVAEDIGKLPDSNVAESLQRVSGVQLDRGIGEGSSVSIRGFRNNVILVNGREIIDGGGRGSGGTDTLNTSTYSLLALLPSEMISRLEVTKQAGSEEIEGSIGGVINIITRTPLSNKGFQASGSLSNSYGALADTNNQKGSFLVSNTFLDDSFGVLFSANIDNKEVREDGFNTFSGYSRLSAGGFDFDNLDGVNTVTDPNGNLLNPDPNDDGNFGLFHQEPRIWQINDDRSRQGINLMAQWRPTSNLEFKYDLLYSKLESERERRWIGTFIPFASIENAELSENEVLMKGTSIREVQSNVEFNEMDSDILSQAISMDWTLSDTFSVSSEFSYSNAENTLHQTFARLLSNDKTDIAFNFNPEVPTLAFDSTILNDINQLNLFQFNDNISHQEADHTAIRVDFNQVINDVISLEYGARYSKIETSYVDLKLATVRPRTPASELSSIIETWSSPDFFSGELPGLPRDYLAFSADTFKQGGCTVLEDFYLNHSDPAQKAAFTNGLNGQSCTNNDHIDPESLVNESFQSYYIKVNFDSEVADMPISGNIGIRYVDRELESIGSQLSADGSKTKLVTNSDNQEILPSAIVKLELTDEIIARFGAAKVLAYPNNSYLRNKLTVKGDGTGTSGSPDLKPFKADQFDISLEYYLDEAMFSIGYFNKSIDSFVVNSTDLLEIPGYVHPDNGSSQALVQKNINGDGGSVDGYELVYQQKFTFLPEPFKGLGISANYSFIESETPFVDIEGNNLPLPGLSKNNFNIVTYWESGPIGFRLAYNWRDEYLDRLGFSDSGVYSDSYEDLSFTARWDISEKMSLDFQATNLLDSRQRLYNTYEEATRSIVEYGSTYTLGFRATF